MAETKEVAGGRYTEQARRDLKLQLDQLDDAERKIDTVAAPLMAANAAIEETRQLLLLAMGINVDIGHCESCEALILPGDAFSPCSDGPDLCGVCAPTYGDWQRDLQDQADSKGGLDEEDVARIKDERGVIAAHLAGGGSLEDKVTQIWGVTNENLDPRIPESRIGNL